MEKQTFWGIDISKSHLDICVYDGTTILHECRIQNTPSKISMAIEHHITQLGLSEHQNIFCLEHTGLYGNHLLRYLSHQQARTYVVSALHLKRSMGLVRGKNDRIDASRIARFIARHHDELLPFQRPGDKLRFLKGLSAQRAQLQSMQVQLNAPVKEHAVFSEEALYRILRKNAKQVATVVQQVVKSIDAQMSSCIASDAQLKTLYTRVCSVVGVGRVLGTELLVVTNGFTRLVDARKLACYCGVAPFEHSSGSSVRGRTRVSALANRRMKMLLHLAALSVIRLKGELREYYLRMKERGKHSMVILNAIRRKIVARVCAVVSQKKNYDACLHVS